MLSFFRSIFLLMRLPTTPPSTVPKTANEIDECVLTCRYADCDCPAEHQEADAAENAAADCGADVLAIVEGVGRDVGVDLLLEFRVELYHFLVEVQRLALEQLLLGVLLLDRSFYVL